MQGPPDRPGEAREERLSPEERRRVRRAALFRPMNLLMVLIGMVFFAITLKWWVIPLTLATYAALIFVAPRDQVVRNRILERHEGRSEARPLSSEDQDILQRARRLPPGETRRKVEDALEARRRTIFAIEESSDVTQAVLGDMVPKLDGAVERLVTIAEKRESAARAVQNPKT